MMRSQALRVPSFSEDWLIKTPSPSIGAGIDAESASARIGAMKRLLTGASKHVVSTKNEFARSDSVEGKLLEKRTSLTRLASTVGMYLDPDWRTRLFARLTSLMDPAEWDESFELPSEQSFSTFLRLIIYLHPTKRPGIGLSAKGYFLASWAKDQERIVVECLPNDDVRWVLSHNRRGFLESGAGKTKIFRLPDVIQPYEPVELFSDAHNLII
ncbi:hypothetical protein ACU4GH_11950 [Bradyrhizobium betae]